MTPAVALRALLGRRAEGWPTPPAPIDFARLEALRSPNAHLAAPAGHAGWKDRTVPPLPATAEAAWEAVRALGERFPRTWRLAEWPELRQAQWVARSRLLNFPDLVAAQVVALPEGTGIYLYSRSLFGRYDFGVNRARATAWLAALDGALRDG